MSHLPWRRGSEATLTILVRFGIRGASALVLVALIGGCSAAPQRRAQRVPIVTAQAEQRSVPYEIEGTGTIEPIQSAQLIPQVGGLVTRVTFREGEEVTAGQSLIQIDPRPFLAASERAAGTLARDRAQTRAARLTLDRSEELARSEAISQSELDDARSTWEALAATVRADSAALASAHIDLANATIRAPIAGKTGALSLHVGDLARANDPNSPAVSINQLRPIRVRFTVPQDDLAELRRQRGRELPVLVAPGQSDTTWFTGKLAFIDNQVDAASGTVLLKGEFPNRDGALWPGEFVRVRLRLYDQHDATVIPTVAIASSQTGPYVYVVKPDTTVETRPVTVTRAWRDLTVIANGLTPGETVVTDGQMRLSPGAKGVLRTPHAAGAESSGARANSEGRKGGGTNTGATGGGTSGTAMGAAGGTR